VPKWDGIGIAIVSAQEAEKLFEESRQGRLEEQALAADRVVEAQLQGVHRLPRQRHGQAMVA
jgi:hypothetical protein